MLKKYRVLISVVGCLVYGVMLFGHYCTGGYEIVVEGKTLGYVVHADAFDSVLDVVNKEIEKDFGAAAKLAPEAELKSCIMAKEQVTPDKELYANIAAMSEYMAEGYLLELDGVSAIHFGSLKDLEDAIQQIKQNYAEEGSCTIQERVSFSKTYVSKADLYTVETGAAYLEEYGLIHVITTQERTYEVAAAFNTVEQEDDTLYEGVRTVEQEGIPGAYEIQTEVICVNGVETDERTVSRTLIESPVDEIVKVGTKPAPPGMGSGTFSCPVRGRFTSGFGARWGRTHKGIDIAASTGTEIVASDTGIVSFSGKQGSYGLLVKVDHQNGFETYYAHCSKLLVDVGDVVEKGQVIALVGNTGNSTGPHCHFEIRKGGEAENPLNYVQIKP